MAIEFIEIGLFESQRYFDGPVAAEIEKNDRVAVLDRAHRLSAFGDDEGRQILINRTGKFFA